MGGREVVNPPGDGYGFAFAPQIVCLSDWMESILCRGAQNCDLTACHRDHGATTPVQGQGGFFPQDGGMGPGQWGPGGPGPQQMGGFPMNQAPGGFPDVGPGPMHGGPGHMQGGPGPMMHQQAGMGGGGAPWLQQQGLSQT